jgi:type IV pilus assembly protein PilB
MSISNEDVKKKNILIALSNAIKITGSKDNTERNVDSDSVSTDSTEASEKRQIHDLKAETADFSIESAGDDQFENGIAVDLTQKQIITRPSKKSQEVNPIIGDMPRQNFQTLRLVEMLVTAGLVQKQVMDQAVEIKRATPDRRRLIDILIEDLGADREPLLDRVARYYGFEEIDPSSVFGNREKLQFVKQLVQSLPPYFYEMAVRRKILPYQLYTNGFDKLIIITPDTTHPDVHAVAKAFQFQKYEVRYVSTANWNELWRQLTFDQAGKQLGLDVEDEFVQVSRDEYENELERSLEEEIGRGKLNDIAENLLADAVRTGASDIHVIPKASHRTEFHFRIDGRLTLWSAITDVRAEAIISVIKDRAKNLDRFEKFLSQDGFAQRVIDNKVIRFRFSTMPVYGSDLRSKLESIVIRVLRGAETTTGVESLGMEKEIMDLFLKAIRKPQGMVIFTGPTGSGKTTSQVAALKTIMDPSVNIITIEDPVEYLIEGCRQVKLNHKLDFEGALRGLLRHDPDIVMVGEMRDRITAEIAVKLANTGHLIFSTLHTNDTISAITRLYNMGIEPFLLAYTINIIVAQRLTRKLCERCKMVDDSVDVDLLLDCGFTEKEIEQTQFYKPTGCVHCIKGYRGRTGIFEVLTMTKEMRKIILKSKDYIDEDALRTYAQQNGMQTLRQASIKLVKQGITSIESVAGIAIED